MKTQNWMVLVAAALSLATARQGLPSPKRNPTVPQPGKKWRMPDAEAAKWVTRIHKLCPPGWTVSARGNDIIVQRDKPVAFVSSAGLINAPSPTEEELRQEEEREKQRAVVRNSVYRLTLEFAPRMSQDEYEKLAAQNEASTKADYALRRRHHVAVGKFNIIRSYTPEEKAHEQAYRAAAKKLVWHRLPDFYTTDLRVMLFHSWGWLDHLDPKDEPVATECSQVVEAMEKLFGIYDPNVARGGGGYGQEESSRQKPR